jgi:hypothetical protein
MNPFSATAACIKQAPGHMKQSFTAMGGAIKGSGAATVKPATIATEVKPATIATEVKPTTIATEVKPATIATEVKPATIATEVKPATIATETKPATIATETKPATIATETKVVANAAPASTGLKGDLVGTTTVRDAAGQPVQVRVTKTVDRVGDETYRLYDDQGKAIGSTKLYVWRTPKDFEEARIVLDYLTTYGPEGQPYTPKVYVDQLYSTSQGLYTGVGKSLHQVAVERSIQEGLGGRVQLDAAFNSHGFHYKTGFRAVDEGLNTQLATLLAEAKAQGIQPNTKNLGGSGLLTMYLPDDAIAAWQQIIAAKPILSA